MYRNMYVRMPDIIESTRFLPKIRLKTFQIRKESSINIWTILSQIGRTHFELASSAKAYARTFENWEQTTAIL